MEEVAGMSGGLPPLALFPEPNVRASLPATEWEVVLDTWLFSLEYRLRLRDQDFKKIKLSQNASGVNFLISYMQSSNSSDASQKERVLFKRTYLLLRRLLLHVAVPSDYATAKLLDLLCHASRKYASINDWKATLKQVWDRDQHHLTQAIEEWKRTTSRTLSSHPSSEKLPPQLQQVDSILKAMPEAGKLLMTGSDYLETLMGAYNRLHANTAARKALTEHLYYCLRCLMSDATSQASLLLDHLYLMKAEAERLSKMNSQEPNLCSSLVCTTSFLRHLASDNAVASGKRGQFLLDYLTNYRLNTRHLHPLAARPKTSNATKKDKGKARADANEEMHIHKASQISQVHDLFPDLRNHYILRLLAHFNDDMEAVVAGLLEPESLPTELRDQGEPESNAVDLTGTSHDLAPRSTPPLPPQRRNVFDGDDFDRLSISADRLHKGRREIKIEKGTQDEHSRRKAAIISALAAFDSDDDERDDTYDVADVGGTVDSTLDTDDRPRPERAQDQNPHEELLYRAWKDNQEIFARDSKTRMSKVRQDLKRDTQTTDEQIEGWAIMLKKDSKLQERLEKKYSQAARMFSGTQTALASRKWQESGATPNDSEEGEPSGDTDGRRVGQAGIRGHRNWGRGGGRGGGSVAGAGNDAATQAARRRKEQGRGRGGANHNRRDGRAKKVGRGMMGAVQQ